MRPVLSRFAVPVVLLAGALGVAGATRAEPLKVVASIAPVHSIAAAVMAEAGEPLLLVPADASPHHFALKPSAAAALAGAGLVLWVGPSLETALARPLETLGAGARVLRLGGVPGLDPIPLPGGEMHRDEHDQSDGHGDGAVDQHFWLDPAVGALWATAIAGALAEADPANATLYHDNAEALRERLAVVEKGIAARLAPLRGREYVVYHDAYRYFGRRFGIAPEAAVVAGDAGRPGARRLSEIAALLRTLDRPCLFAEPQEASGVLDRLAGETGARIGTLDPLGRDLAPGPGLYPALLEGLAEALAGCLDA